MRRLTVALALLTAAGCATPMGRGHASSSSSPAIGSLTLDQIHARLKQDAAAHKVAVAHFWATWCGPCVEEFPNLAKLYEGSLKFDDKVDFFAIAVDSGSPDDVASFAGNAAATFPIYLAIAPDPDAFQRGLAADWPGVLPTTFVYGPDGRLQLQYRGEIDDLPLFAKKLKSLE